MKRLAVLLLLFAGLPVFAQTVSVTGKLPTGYTGAMITATSLNNAAHSVSATVGTGGTVSLVLYQKERYAYSVTAVGTAYPAFSAGPAAISTGVTAVDITQLLNNAAAPLVEAAVGISSQSGGVTGGGVSTSTVNGKSPVAGNITLGADDVGALSKAGGAATGGIGAPYFYQVDPTVDGFTAYPCLGIRPPFGAAATNYLGYGPCLPGATPVAFLFPPAACPNPGQVVWTPTILSNGTLVNQGACVSLASTAATVAIGTVTTGAAGSAITVTNSGTSTNAIFNFSFPPFSGSTGSSNPSNITGTLVGGAAGPVADGETAIQGYFPSLDKGGALTVPTAAGYIAAWIKVDLPGSGNFENVVSLHSTTGQSAVNLGVFDYGGGMYTAPSFVETTGANHGHQMAANIAGVWHRLVVTWTAGYMYVGIDGTVTDTLPYSGSLDSTPFTVQFGPGSSNSGDASRSFTLAKVLVGNTWWNGAQIASDFSPGSSVTGAAANTGTACISAYDAFYAGEPGASGYWSMCERGTNPSIHDTVGNPPATLN